MADENNNGLALKSRDGYTGKLFLPSTADIATLNQVQTSVNSIDPTARFIVSSTEPETADDGKIWVDVSPSSSLSDITYTAPPVYLPEITNDSSGLLYQATITPYSKSTYKPVSITLSASITLRFKFVSYFSTYSAGSFIASFTSSSPVFFMIKFTDYWGSAYAGISPSSLTLSVDDELVQPGSGYLDISYDAPTATTYLVPSVGESWLTSNSNGVQAAFLGDLSLTYTVGANGGGMFAGKVSISSDYSSDSNRYVTSDNGELSVNATISAPKVTWSTD